MAGHRIRFDLIALATVLWLAALAVPALAQTRTGLDVARDIGDRLVLVNGRRGPGQTAEPGWGLIVGARAAADGSQELIVVTPDILVRDPARPGFAFEPPAVAFRADPARGVLSRLMPERLSPEQGNIAVLVVPRPDKFEVPPAGAAEDVAMMPGTPVWQLGRERDWEPRAQPGRLALMDKEGWLVFEGIDSQPPGGIVVSDKGIVGINTGPHPRESILSRAVPIALISVRLRAWGYPWDIAAPGAAPVRRAPPRQAPAATLNLPPITIVQLLAGELAARNSFFPKGARVSPWPDNPVRLFSAPRRDAAGAGTLPTGRSLPSAVMVGGAYEILARLDKGAWFLIGTGGQALGYAPGAEIVEVWPSAETAGLAGGKVVREWTVAGGRRGLLRDVGTHFELETAAVCQLPTCTNTTAFTPPPPAPGGVIPTFQSAAVTGTWRRDDIVSLRLQLPRHVVEREGATLMVCVGIEDGCAPEQLYPPAK